MHLLSTLLAVAPALVAAQNCPIQFDGRVPKGAKLGLLDTEESPFNADYVKGAGEFWGASYFLGRGFGGRVREGDSAGNQALRLLWALRMRVLKPKREDRAASEEGGLENRGFPTCG